MGMYGGLSQALAYNDTQRRQDEDIALRQDRNAIADRRNQALDSLARERFLANEEDRKIQRQYQNEQLGLNKQGLELRQQESQNNQNWHNLQQATLRNQNKNIDQKRKKQVLQESLFDYINGADKSGVIGNLNENGIPARDVYSDGLGNVTIVKSDGTKIAFSGKRLKAPYTKKESENAKPKETEAEKAALKFKYDQMGEISKEIRKWSGALSMTRDKNGNEITPEEKASITKRIKDLEGKRQEIEDSIGSGPALQLPSMASTSQASQTSQNTRTPQRFNEKYEAMIPKEWQKGYNDAMRILEFNPNDQKANMAYTRIQNYLFKKAQQLNNDNSMNVENVARR